MPLFKKRKKEKKGVQVFRGPKLAKDEVEALLNQENRNLDNFQVTF